MRAIRDAIRDTLDAMWGATQIAFHLALGPVLHRWRTRWGATDAELHRPLPGDDLVPRPDWSYTHAVTVRAPRAVVWQWLVRLGRARRWGYDADVTEMEPGRALVLGGEHDARGSAASWSFHLVDRADGSTRLIERGRHEVGRGPRARLGTGPYLLDPVGFVESRRTLRAIKALAERSRRPTASGS